MAKFYLFTLIFISFWAHAAPEQFVALRKATELREKPNAQSQVIAQLKESEEAQLLSFSGGWAKIKSKKNEGFVKIFFLKTLKPSTPLQANNELKSGSKRSIASSGIKGVSEENLKHLEPAPELATQLDHFVATPEEQKNFIMNRGLKTISIK